MVRLAPRSAPEDTIRALEYLLQEAKAGRIVGFACVAMHRVDDYTLDATGACKLLPHLTRGMLATLDDELALLEPAQA